MKQLFAFTKKELLEQYRTGKLMFLAILFCLFGIMNPAIAKLLPWMMEIMSEQLAQNGMSVSTVEVDAMTSWVQFFKNMPIALIVFIIMFSGILTAEYQKGTLINIITKGMKRWKILVSKLGVLTLFWTLGCLISFGITFGYNTYFWDNDTVQNIYFAVFCFYLFGLWLLSVLLLASAFFHSASAVTLTVGVAFLAAYLPGLIPAVNKYSPACLLEPTSLLTGAKSIGNYEIALIITTVLIILGIVFTVMVFNKKNM